MGRHSRIFQLVSDRFAANRHYYLRRPNALHVSCEVKALAVFLDSIEIDPAGRASMLGVGYHLGNLTLLRKVKCLPHARHLDFRAFFGIERYWNYPYGELQTWTAGEAELAEALHQHLVRALKRRMRNVKKVLLPISGGLDSRTMAGLLARSDYPDEVLAYTSTSPHTRRFHDAVPGTGRVALR